jgi:hypothetical protein
LEELGFDYEITSEGVSFSRSGTAVEEYGPATRIGAAPFLGLTGTAEVGSLDQVIDVSDYKGLHRCPVLVHPKSKVKGAKSTYYKFCANPSKFQVNGWHFCGVHKLTFQNHPDALEEGMMHRIFDCETDVDVLVCSRAHGMGLAYSLQDAHVKGHCERVGANPGMKMKLPFNLGPTPKDQDLLSIVPRVIPDFGVNTSASGEQAEFKGFEDDRKKGGENDSDDSAVSGKNTASQMGTDSEEDDQARDLRIAAAAAGGPSGNIDFGGQGPPQRRRTLRSKQAFPGEAQTQAPHPGQWRSRQLEGVIRATDTCPFG